MADGDIEARFEGLEARWRAETRFLSSTVRLREHSAFREIVALGEPAVPLIVARLRDGPSHLFLALHEITGDNPIPEEHRGRIAEICDDWVTWFDARASRNPGP